MSHGPERPFQWPGGLLPQVEPGDQPYWWRQMRRRVGSRILWGTFASLWISLSAYMLASGWGQRDSAHFGLWLLRGVSPGLAYFAGCIWVAPGPWEWAWRPGRSRSIGKGLLAAIAVSEAYVVGMVCVDAILRMKLGRTNDFLSSLLYHLSFFGPAMVVVGGIVAHRDQIDLDREVLKQVAEEAQTRLLQSQLHPHVLFNSLNGLAELILRDPTRAERSVRALSDLLRKLLDASRSTFLPLANERGVVEDYLVLEAMRLGDRLEVVWEWDSSLGPLPVVPLLLQPLAENAIKHGIGPHVPGGRLGIEARRQHTDLVLRVWNTGAPLSALEGRGIGLTNLRARMALAYGEAARLDLWREGERSVVEVRVGGLLNQPPAAGPVSATG